MSWVDINSEPRKIQRPSLIRLLEKDHPDSKAVLCKMISRVLEFKIKLPNDGVTLPGLDEVMTQLGRAQFRYKLMLRVDEALKARSMRTFYQTPQEIWDLKENCAKMVALLEKMASKVIELEEQVKQNEAQNRGVETEAGSGKDTSAVGTEAAPVGLS